MMCGLAFIPIDSVETYFDALKEEVPNVFIPIYEYLKKSYLSNTAQRGRGRGRPRILPRRYPIPIWNQYLSVLERTARTNNIS